MKFEKLALEVRRKLILNLATKCLAIFLGPFGLGLAVSAYFWTNRTGASLSALPVVIGILIPTLFLALKILTGPQTNWQQAAASKIDSVLNAKERATSILDLAKNEPRRQLINEQLSQIAKNHEVSEIAPLQLSKNHIFSAALGVISIVVAFLLVINRPVPEEYRIIKELIENTPQISEPLQQRLDYLAEAFRDGQLTDEQIQDALDKTQQQLDREIESLEKNTSSEKTVDQEIQKDQSRQATPTPTPNEAQKESKTKEDKPQDKNTDVQNSTESKDKDGKREDKSKSQGSGKNQDQKSSDQSEGKKQEQGGQQQKEDQQGKGQGQQKQEQKGQQQGQQENQDGQGQGGQSQEPQGKGQEGDKESKDNKQDGKDGQSKSEQSQNDKEGKKEGDSGKQENQPGSKSGTQGQSPESKQKQDLNQIKDALNKIQDKRQEAQKDKKQDQPGKSPQKDGSNPEKKEKPEQGKENEQKPDQKQQPGKQPNSPSGDPALGQNQPNNDRKMNQPNEKDPAKEPPIPQPNPDKPPGDQAGEGTAPNLPNKQFNQVEVAPEDEKFNSEFTSQQGELARNKNEAKFKTSISAAQVSKPEAIKNNEEQNIPLEYKDILK